MFQQILASATLTMNNPPPEGRETKGVHTDYHFEGEFFRSKTQNQYFCVMDKNRKVGDLSSLKNFGGDFRPLDQAIQMLHKYDPEKDVLLRLEFTKHKYYFVESYQAISIQNPDVTVMNMPLDELISMTPKFEPLPQG